MKRNRDELYKEYDMRTRRTKKYIIDGKCDKIYAEEFYDRAITCRDLASDYMNENRKKEALVLLGSGIRDLWRAQDIYKTLNRNSFKNKNKKCEELTDSLKSEIENISAINPELNKKDGDLYLTEIDEDPYDTDTSASTLVSSSMPMFRKRSNSRPQSTTETLENSEIIDLKSNW